MGVFLVISASPYHHLDLWPHWPLRHVAKATEHNGGICNFPKTTTINIFSQRTYWLDWLRSQKERRTRRKRRSGWSSWHVAEGVIGRTALLLYHLVPLAVVERIALEQLGAVETSHQGVSVHTLCTAPRLNWRFRWHCFLILIFRTLTALSRRLLAFCKTFGRDLVPPIAFPHLWFVFWLWSLER